MRAPSHAELIQGLKHDDIFVRSGILSHVAFSIAGCNEVEFSAAVLDVLENKSWDDAFVSSSVITGLLVTEEIGRRIFALVADPSKGENEDLAEKERIRTLIEWYSKSPPEFLIESVADFEAIGIVGWFLTEIGDRGKLELAKFRAAISCFDEEETLQLVRELNSQFEIDLEEDYDFPETTERQLDVAIAHFAQLGGVKPKEAREWFALDVDFADFEEESYGRCTQVYRALLMAKYAKVKLDLTRCLELMDCGWDWIESAATEAVKAFADDETILELQSRYPSCSEGVRISLTEIFEQCHSEKAITKLIQLASEEPDPFHVAILGGVLLRIATPASIEAAYQIYLSDPDENERSEIAKILYAFKAVRGESSVEMDGWRTKCEEELEGRGEYREMLESLDFFNPNRENANQLSDEEDFENEYHPEMTPHPADWLDRDEGERLADIQDYVDYNESFIESPGGHASIHLVIENQLAEKYEPTVETLAQLQKGGVSRHSAIHAIGSVIAMQLNSIAGGRDAMTKEEYAEELNRLDPEVWKNAAEGPMAEALSHGSETSANYVEFEGMTYQREAPKIGRNDPCTCGSGKKYKKCCLKFAN